MQNASLFDFTTDAGRNGWQATHDLAPLTPDKDGLRFDPTGDDPYAFGPAVTVPAKAPLYLSVRLKATRSGMGQVFFFAENSGPSEPDSVRFAVRGGDWNEIKVPLPPLSTDRMRFRIDPPGGAGDRTIISSLALLPRIVFPEPEWPIPTVPPADDPVVQTVAHGMIVLKHGTGWGHLAIGVNGTLFALGNTHPLIGYQKTPDSTLTWLNADYQRQKGFGWSNTGEYVTCHATDSDNAHWEFEQRVAPSRQPGILHLRLTLKVSEDRYLVHFPLLTLFCGLGSFGEKRSQALLSGVEYLEGPDTSSSQADLKGEQAQRQTPAPHMLTLPLMALASEGRYLALAWEPSDWVTPCFDIPDRRYKSGSQVMGLLSPGNRGENERPPGSLLPYSGKLLKAGEPLIVRATLLAGMGDTVADAVKAYLAFKGMPPLPTTYPVPKAASLLATGWLKSHVHEGSRYRHAYPGDFAPGPAADAACCQEALAALPGVGEASALRSAARQAITAVPPADRFASGVGHVRTFTAPLVYGEVPVNLERMRQHGRDMLSRFRSDGTVKYERPPTGNDLGVTHFADHVNGMAGDAIAQALEAAALTGDRTLREESLRVLSAVVRQYRHTVPRGAQTWEVPLHTPDILASAHLVRAAVLGYELSGDKRLLEEARYWAWTGVPFVYLATSLPSGQPKDVVNLYGTTPVLGATQWVAPNWIGLPVQWCGLVYANALYDLATHDTTGIWKQLADGIVVSGLQQTWPVGSDKDRQGLLPDSFNLLAQIRNDVAINPATLQVPYLRSIGRPLYERRLVAPGGPFIHAPGAVQVIVKSPVLFEFTVTGWPSTPYQALVTGLRRTPSRVTIGGKQVPVATVFAEGRLLLTLRGRGTVTVA